MKRTALAVLGLTLSLTLPTARAGVPAEDVRQALDRAAKFLLDGQSGDNWEAAPTADYYAEQKTGWTALAVDALLSAKVSPRDPKVEAAVKFLKGHSTSGVYALGLRMQVWQRLPRAADVKRAAQDDLDKLLADVGRRGEAQGMYGYFGPTKTAYSHSRTQYAVQGAAAAEEMGLEVPSAWWRTVEAAWVDHQAADGGWTYTKKNTQGHPETNGMTTVAVASLLLAHEALHQDESNDCRGAVPDPAIAKGLKWLADHADTIGTDDRSPRAYPYPTLYGVERVGAAGGIKYFGTVNWYEKGATWLLSTQHKDGSWGTRAKQLDGSTAAFQDTCFAMLFLARGQVPLLAQKLDYSAATAAAPTPAGQAAKATQWAERPRDVSNLARQVGKGLEQELGWQVVPLSAPAGEFHDAPILYVADKDGVSFDDAAVAKLRAFTEGGGLIVANADCGGPAFAGAIQKLGRQIAPAYEFRNLPANHPILTHQQFPATRWKRRAQVMGLSNGVRELVVLLAAGDPAKAWNAGGLGGHEADFELGADLFQYVASRGDFRSRGESYVVDRDASVKATKQLAVGRLKYAGNWDPEPGGWRALADGLHNTAKVDVDVKPVTATDDWSPLAVVHLTGTEKPTLPAAVAAKAKAYVAGGGLVLADAAGGSAAFATGIEPTLEQWAGGKLELIPADDPVFAAGGKLGPVKYRPFAIERLGKLNAPRLRGVKVNGRLGVILSGEDLSAGLVGQQVDGVVGYDPATATDIVRHVVLYAAEKQGK